MHSNKRVYFPYIHNGMFSFKLLTTKNNNSEDTLYCKNVFETLTYNLNWLNIVQAAYTYSLEQHAIIGTYMRNNKHEFMPKKIQV